MCMYLKNDRYWKLINFYCNNKNMYINGVIKKRRFNFLTPIYLHEIIYTEVFLKIDLKK